MKLLDFCIDQARLYATALTFLTRFPWVAKFSYPDQIAIARSSGYWPSIGSLLGALAALVMLGADGFFSTGIAAWCAIATVLIATGGFHEDGLADCADGLFGGYSVERRLEIMKDSRIGSFAGLALVVVLGLQAQALADLLSKSSQLAVVGLIFAHSLGRYSCLIFTRWLPYVGTSTFSKPLANSVSMTSLLMGGLWMVTLLTLGFFLGLLSEHAIAAILLANVLLWWLCARLLRSKIGGITGDALGAVNVLTQTLCLVVMSVD